ncbi:hypothetical protein M501DRAFT_941132 [Patellaria atrata CBS 101060]|uniref:MPN domain-containing protein n=1 Tax=Patellaria atrata CBS 101060 TaxID=1346257 RepID=A0A9P4S6B2_9PEZI|nr:hypothetical protein M501DRAFT_941132 [Patellaria atrata CBS 101060]
MGGHADNGPGSEPLSVPQIVKKASAFDYNDTVRLRYWLRTADTLLKEADIYEREGNDQQTYFLLFRHAILVFEKLNSHPDSKQPETKDALNEANKAVSRNLAKLEALKPRITKRYNQFQELAEKHKAQREDLERSRKTSRIGASLAQGFETLEPGQNDNLAVKLAQKEIRRRDATRKGLPDSSWFRGGLSRRNTGESDVDDLSQSIVEARRRNDETFSNRSSSESSGKLAIKTAPYRYPNVPKKSTLLESWGEAITKPLASNWAMQSPTRDSMRSAEVPPQRPPKLGTDRQVPPPRPAKEFEIQELDSSPALPPRPSKVASLSSFSLSDSSEQLSPISRESTSTPPIQEINSSDYAFKPSAYLENGTPLRTIFLPPTLRTTFLAVAAPNTRMNLETCGILCGTLISNALFVSKLVIPKQKSTSDTCETTDEEELFGYCDEHDLMVLGWIHTHPTQSCFMSSRDLHTHCGYQVMMPESIAIVCAPARNPAWGVFRLTDPPGMKTVLNCRQTGLFHPHGESNIYTDATRPGHVCELKGLEFEVVDLR